MEFRQGVGKKIKGKARERGGSLGNIEELLKKKRERSEEEKKDGEEGRCFQRSKMTVRSPLKGGGEREERDAGSGIGEEWKAMEEIKGMMEKMWEDQKRGMKVLEGVMKQFRRE